MLPAKLAQLLYPCTSSGVLMGLAAHVSKKWQLISYLFVDVVASFFYLPH